MKAILLLMLIVAPCCAATWSGRMVITEAVDQPPVPADERARLADFIAELDASIAKARARLDGSLPEEVALIEGDIIAFEAQQRRARMQQGGRFELRTVDVALDAVPLDPTTLAGSEARIRALVDGAVLLATWSDGLIRRRDRWGRFEGALPLIRPQYFADLSQEAGLPVLGHATRRADIVAEGKAWVVEWAPDLPNAWAACTAQDLDAQTLPYALARFPGMPMRVSHELVGGGVRTLAVTELQPGALPEEAFQRP